MANMSYCRFQNTERDFQDCVNAVGDPAQDFRDLSPEELRAAKRLAMACEEYLELYRQYEESDDPEEEEEEEEDEY